jgi:hypothetical protein
MAHLVEQMAYVGQTPWHGLGNALAPRQSIDVWAKQAGMNWDIRRNTCAVYDGKSTDYLSEKL